MSSCPPGACVPFQGWSRSSPGSCVHSGSLFTSLGNRHSSAPARGNSLAAAGAAGAGAGSAAGAAGHLLPDPPAPRPSPGRVFANITNLMQLDLRTAGPVGCRSPCRLRKAVVCSREQPHRKCAMGRGLEMGGSHKSLRRSRGRAS